MLNAKGDASYRIKPDIYAFSHFSAAGLCHAGAGGLEPTETDESHLKSRCSRCYLCSFVSVSINLRMSQPHQSVHLSRRLF